MRSSGNRSGFTLIELIVTVAIIGILSVITFKGFADERNKSAARRAAEQLQVNLQAAQNNAQSGIRLSSTKLCRGSAVDGLPCTLDSQCDVTQGGTTCTALGTGTCGVCVYRAPAAYGVRISDNQTNYVTFSDIDTDGASLATHPNGINDGGAEFLDTKFLATGLTIYKLKFDGVVCTSSCISHTTFGVPLGEAKIIKGNTAPTPPSIHTSLEVIIRHTRLNLCYSVAIQTTSGTVSRKKLVTCP